MKSIVVAGLAALAVPALAVPTLAASTLAVSTLVASILPARADAPGADWMSRDQITKMLTAKGYSAIRGLEADDGHWEANATLDGRDVEVHVDPHSGAITKSEPDDD